MFLCTRLGIYKSEISVCQSSIDIIIHGKYIDTQKTSNRDDHNRNIALERSLINDKGFYGVATGSTPRSHLLKRFNTLGYLFGPYDDLLTCI